MSNLTIRDIAKMAGVSPTAVSFVINNRSGVSQETRKKVSEIIQRTGFTPNIHSKRLNSGKSLTIHLVLRHYVYPLYNQFAQETLIGVFKASKAFGYSVVFTYVDEQMGTDQILESVRSKDCDGVILNQFADMALITALQFENIPYVCVDCHLNKDGALPLVEVDYYRAAFQATNYLCQSGHKEIGFIGPALPQNYYTNTFGGYMAALKQSGLIINPSWVFTTDLVEHSAEDVISEFLQSTPLPTAFLCAGDSYAIDTMRCLKSMGLRIPEDISVIGLDDLMVSRYLEPPLTSVTFNKEQIGYLATELLYQIIQNQPYNSVNLISTTLEIRGSVKNITNGE